MLSNPGRLFEKLQKIDKMYRRYYQLELAEYGFTPNEVAVILFLYNNAPDMDTASDIVRCKGISKGLVARSAESLCQKGYLAAVRDPDDRRIVHLELSGKCGPIIDRIENRQNELARRIEAGVAKDALAITSETLDTLLVHTELLLKEKVNHGE